MRSLGHVGASSQYRTNLTQSVSGETCFRSCVPEGVTMATIGVPSQNDQEKAQSEKDSRSKNRVGEKTKINTS